MSGETRESGHVFAGAKGQEIQDTWILLDNQSNVNVFKNAALVRNIRRSPVTLDVYCNAGMRTTNQVADFDNYGEVWYDLGGRINIFP